MQPLKVFLTAAPFRRTATHTLSKMDNSGNKIGIFDSGYGGLTILQGIRERLPEYDYVYLGDNARAPYGTRSFQLVYEFTLQAVRHLFDAGCRLVILACNTASAKALRTIQQNDLPGIDPRRRVLGVIRPTVENIGDVTLSRHIGVVGTPGTVQSHSYRLEVAKLFPDVTVNEQPCPLWVPLIENGEATGDGADYFVRKYLEQLLGADPKIDAIVLGCTHYPLLLPKIRKYLPDGVRIVAQANIVADSLADYLRRHPEMDNALSRDGSIEYLTTESTDKFDALASLFVGEPVASKRILL